MKKYTNSNIIPIYEQQFYKNLNSPDNDFEDFIYKDEKLYDLNIKSNEIISTNQDSNIETLESLQNDNKKYENVINAHQNISNNSIYQQTNNGKRKKQNIPKNIRNLVWYTYIGSDIIKHRCLCCKKAIIYNTSFECGHILSEKHGGTLEISNLRPICSQCNKSMCTMNMIEYIKKYGLYI